MAADNLVPCITRSSAFMILIMWVYHVLVFSKESFQLHVQFQCWPVVENINIFLFNQEYTAQWGFHVKRLSTELLLVSYSRQMAVRSLSIHAYLCHLVNSSPPEQDGCHFAVHIFRCILMNEKFCILIQISLKFVPKGQIDYKSALVQVMAWRRTGEKPLPEPMLTQFTDAYMRH